MNASIDIVIIVIRSNLLAIFAMWLQWSLASL